MNAGTRPQDECREIRAGVHGITVKLVCDGETWVRKKYHIWPPDNPRKPERGSYTVEFTACQHLETVRRRPGAPLAGVVLRLLRDSADSTSQQTDLEFIEGIKLVDLLENQYPAANWPSTRQSYFGNSFEYKIKALRTVTSRTRKSLFDRAMVDSLQMIGLYSLIPPALMSNIWRRLRFGSGVSGIIGDF